MNILVISGNYPSKSSPNSGAFVYNLMQQLSKHHQITVISPEKINNYFKKDANDYGREACEVYRPFYLSVSNRKVLNFDSGQLTAFFYKRAILQSLKRLQYKPDLIYVHFLTNACPILDYAIKENIPLVVASGESTYTAWLQIPLKIRNRVIDKVAHIVCVSKENKIQLEELGFDHEKIDIIPNAVDYTLFRPMDKDVCKEKLGLSKDKFTVGFIGHFIHRKGPNRIIEAIRTLGDENIHLVCVGGKGELQSNNFTTQMNAVPNYQLPEIYNAFDVFVLPTLHEGNCNVIEEAKACAIPIISSKGTSVEEQIDESIGKLIDPMNINEIANSIFELKNDCSKLQIMKEQLMNRRGENSLEERAKKIDRILRSTLNVRQF